MSGASGRVARVVAAVNPLLAARVVRRTPLFYARGADAALDRPAHVRAGSALARLGPDALAVVQDDASFLAILDGLDTGVRVRDIPLPSHEGVRQFDDSRGNKKDKLDLEACLVLDDAEAAELLVAFGSGSTAAREHVVLVERPNRPDARVTIVRARALYGALRVTPAFAGSELNIEGAALAGDDVLLLQRGNGAPREHLAPVDATARLDRRALLAYLRSLEGRGAVLPCPPLRHVVEWDLGTIAGTRLTFTDGVFDRGSWTAFVACAEASPDATHDGPVTGVALGRLDDHAHVAELAMIEDEQGAPLLDKAEGVAFDVHDRTRAWLVIDRDDPAAPAELLELALGEGWK